MLDPAALAQHKTVICVFTPEETQHTLVIPLAPTLLPGGVASGIPLSSALNTNDGLSKSPFFFRMFSSKSK